MPNLFLRELASFYRFFWKIPKAEKKILIYAEHSGYYPCFEGIIEKLIGEHGHVIYYVTSEANDPILRNSNQHLKTFYVNKLLTFLMAFLDVRVCVLTLTDLNQLHIKRSINPVSYVYVFHSPVSTHMMYRYGAFDHYDYILCVGPHHVQEIRSHERRNGLMPKKLIEAGYYRLERIYQLFQKSGSALDQRVSTTPKTVLIAPSWGMNNVLEKCGIRLVEILLQANYRVIVRPHPETVRRSPRLIESFAAAFASNAQFTLETSIASDESLLHADVLICDCSGVALEYAFGTERPVLFIDIPPKVRNQRFKELEIEPLELLLRKQIGEVISPDQLDTIPQAVSRLIENREGYRNRLVALRNTYIYAFGNSADTGARCIHDLARKGDTHET
jgi:YidC/Oxa1 family membrane protein insertase